MRIERAFNTLKDFTVLNESDSALEILQLNMSNLIKQQNLYELFSLCLGLGLCFESKSLRWSWEMSRQCGGEQRDPSQQ